MGQDWPALLGQNSLAEPIVVADNLGSHKNQAARQAIRKAAARLVLLPKYSPDLNPIEQVYAKLKHLLRKAAKRSRVAVSDTVAELLDTYTPAECANYFRQQDITQTKSSRSN